jgi:ankyrin repeat protein
MNHSSSVDKLPVLILAAQRGHHQVVKLLIQHGANVNAMTADEGSTALMQAGLVTLKLLSLLFVSK